MKRHWSRTLSKRMHDYGIERLQCISLFTMRAYLRKAFGMSDRRPCKTIGYCRMTIRYKTARADDAGLRQRMKAIAHERRRFGYRRLHVLLKREGYVINHKKLFRLYREEKLAVRRRGGRKRAIGTRAPMLVPVAPNDRWSLDFVSDQLTDGRRFRILTVVFQRAAEDDITSFVDCPMNANSATKPGMMPIKNLATNGPVGVLKPRCIIAAAPIRALTAARRIKPTSPHCRSARQPNPADAPLIDAEILFRQPGPAHSSTETSSSRYSRSYLLKSALLLPAAIYLRSAAARTLARSPTFKVMVTLTSGAGPA